MRSLTKQETQPTPQAEAPPCPRCGKTDRVSLEHCVGKMVGAMETGDYWWCSRCLAWVVAGKPIDSVRPEGWATCHG